MHTPDIEAAKVWVGNMGKTATHAVLYAQLYTEPGGKSHGLHAFVVPLRNPKTLIAYPGVVVGDMGEKLGQNGIDNGFLMFHQYRIPRENLLNRSGDVTPDGQYVSKYKDVKSRQSANLGSLSSGRVGITSGAASMLQLCMPIVVRYSAARRQFGPDEENPNNELPVIEYPLQVSKKLCR